MGLNATALLASVITAVVNGIAIYLATRYTARLVEKFEKNGKNGKGTPPSA